MIFWSHRSHRSQTDGHVSDESQRSCDQNLEPLVRSPAVVLDHLLPGPVPKLSAFRLRGVAWKQGQGEVREMRPDFRGTRGMNLCQAIRCRST